jgi:hypothetical protein
MIRRLGNQECKVNKLNVQPQVIGGKLLDPLAERMCLKARLEFRHQ